MIFSNIKKNHFPHKLLSSKQINKEKHIFENQVQFFFDWKVFLIDKFY